MILSLGMPDDSPGIVAISTNPLAAYVFSAQLMRDREASQGKDGPGISQCEADFLQYSAAVLHISHIWLSYRSRKIQTELEAFGWLNT
jgi:hypothetical protein